MYILTRRTTSLLLGGFWGLQIGLPVHVNTSDFSAFWLQTLPDEDPSFTDVRFYYIRECHFLNLFPSSDRFLLNPFLHFVR
jgi:hypothetical protein